MVRLRKIVKHPALFRCVTAEKDFRMGSDLQLIAAVKPIEFLSDLTAVHIVKS
jgi:hypothetical protein